MKLIDLHALWAKLADVPTDQDGNLDAPFLHFGVGTPREDVWHWFEAQHLDFSVAHTMGFGAPDTAGALLYIALNMLMEKKEGKRWHQLVMPLDDLIARAAAIGICMED